MIPYIKVSRKSKLLVNNWLLFLMELMVVEKGEEKNRRANTFLFGDQRQEIVICREGPLQTQATSLLQQCL